ncbi:hydroxymyristoyl-ACP dehydratase [Candidatus Thiodictyon syntrophicum]|uniref:3-hydroxylacyl-ACP dehydratase n=1 Tax=Candidatus Thiodictyon syntrophicum TaxID=1166950 RepID=A0A2K8U3A5_9GAMM|nr:hydroxymyristoyl-ACP dehydratase [Candidatus Thiodictyon syntrophicum]AUB80027.1 hypothetical protein THSYN_02975 [Candidatus Thiodictyon syntrophicum]
MSDSNDLCALLPHAAPMCLLDTLVSWDPESLVCTAVSHGDPHHPLRRNGRLAAVHAIEYACQATALHAALAARAAPDTAQRSLLAAVKEITLSQDYLDQIEAPLRISVWRELALGPSAIYRFLVEGGGLPVAGGRLTVVGGLGGCDQN